jgi:K+-sensing histidine kinase KdpD
MVATMSDIFYALYDNDSKLVVSTIKEKHSRLLTEIIDLSSSVIIDNVIFKYLKTTSDQGTCIAITTKVDYSKSRKVFEKHLHSLIDSIEPIKLLSRQATDELSASTHRLIHNLTSINAHNVQEIYSEFPQELISASGKKNIAKISHIIDSKPKKIASMVLRFAKNNAAMKAEFSVFKRLYNRNATLDMGQHKVHRVIMNIVYTFFPDFTEKNVNLRIHDSNEQAYLDYETVHVALYHMLDNAEKYTKMGTNLDIYIRLVENRIVVSFDMMSIVIDDSETELIYQEGYSGKFAHELFKSGHGIGMSRIKEMLNLNKATIEVERKGKVIVEEKNGLSVSHQNNIFHLSFLSKKPLDF